MNRSLLRVPIPVALLFTMIIAAPAARAQDAGDEDMPLTIHERLWESPGPAQDSPVRRAC
jgi:hypothetical protein